MKAVSLASLSRMIWGELGLARTYWLFCILGYAAAFGCTVVLGTMREANPQYWIGLVGALLSLLPICYAVLVCIGVFNAARGYPGRAAWAWLAKATSMLGVLCIVGGAAFSVVG